jgi:translation initiation factor IF-2
MAKISIINRILDAGVVPIIRCDSAEQALGAAKAIAEEAASVAKRLELSSQEDNKPAMGGGIEELMAAIESSRQKIFRVVLKGDVAGTVEALSSCLSDIKSDKVKLEIVGEDVGQISKNDIIMASAAGAAVIGFNVKLESGVQAIAKHHSVQIIQHNIIYELITQVKEGMAELLEPELREHKLGAAEVRQVFTVGKGTVAGCMVTEGRIERDSQARVLRGGDVIHQGRVGTLKRFKDDVSEVRAGYECGIRIEGFDGYREGDVLEAFTIEKIRPNL